MKISIFIKTLLILLISFSIVFLLNMYISYTRFGPMYIDENIEAVKESILLEASKIENGTALTDTTMYDLSRSETSFILIEDYQIIEELGPILFTEPELLNFIIGVYDSQDSIQENQLVYYVNQEDDVYNINYIYEFEFGDYLIINTKIQSLTNVDKVLNNINQTQSIFLFVTITLLSVLISVVFTKPIKKINVYAKKISNLEFDGNLDMKRRDEFRDLVSSLNEMTFNLKRFYQELDHANKKLSNDIEFEKQQEEKKKNLIMTINHEIKTPLSVMKGMIEGMLDGVGRYKDKEKYLNELVPQIEEIELITKDLTYSLMLEDKASLKDMCSTAVINAVIDSQRELVTQHDVNVSTSIQEESLFISDELLSILVTNLLKNAVLYTTDNKVQLLGKSYQNEYILEVRNKGYIKEEDLDKIFDSFYRSDSLQLNKKGSGLGLFIIKQICDIYGHTYKVFNDGAYVVVKISFKTKK